jgi:hypothetical protein
MNAVSVRYNGVFLVSREKIDSMLKFVHCFFVM